MKNRCFIRKHASTLALSLLMAFLLLPGLVFAQGAVIVYADGSRRS